MNTAIVAIGSNIDPDVHIPRALLLLGKEQRLRDTSDFMQSRLRGNGDGSGIFSRVSQGIRDYPGKKERAYQGRTKNHRSGFDLLEWVDSSFRL